MKGWRARIGLVIPSTNTVNETEWQEWAPRGVSVHSARMKMDAHSGADSLNKMITNYQDAARKISSIDLDVLAFGCTTGSLIKGPEFEEKLSEELSNIAGCSATTTSASIVNAFEELDLNSLSIVSPYDENLNSLLVNYLEHFDFQIDRIIGGSIEKNLDVGRVTPQAVYYQVMELGSIESDGLFISCTDYRTFEIIETLEHDLDKPVITSNQATLWKSLQLAGVNPRNIGLGALFNDT